MVSRDVAFTRNYVCTGDLSDSVFYMIGRCQKYLQGTKEDVSFFVVTWKSYFGRTIIPINVTRHLRVWCSAVAK